MDFTVFGLIAFVAIVVINFIAIRRAHRFAALHARLSGEPAEARLPEPFTYRNPEPLPPMWLLGLPCDKHEDCRNDIALGRACAAQEVSSVSNALKRRRARPERQLPGPPTSQLR